MPRRKQWIYFIQFLSAFAELKLSVVRKRAPFTQSNSGSVHSSIFGYGPTPNKKFYIAKDPTHDADKYLDLKKCAATIMRTRQRQS